MLPRANDQTRVPDKMMSTYATVSNFGRLKTGWFLASGIRQ
ncbi:MAG: hypothetical protein OXD44_02835 [Gammaproteobacteria bacterium]|nr:hypothetical protein [Gammaproteobacteria bacterium]